MSGRVYAVSFAPTAATVAVDFAEFTPADDKPIEILAVYLSQTTEIGDAQDEMCAWSIVRGHTTSGSGGSSATPRPVKRTDAAAGFAAEVMNTTPATTSGTTIHNGAFNVRVGEAMVFPEGLEIDASQADTTLVVRLLAAPTDSTTFTGTIYVRELG